MKITDIQALEILDSRGNPTVEVKVILEDGSYGVACVPSGASTGSKEALELRDKDPKKFGGKGVTKAIANIEGKIKSAVVNLNAFEQRELDNKLLKLDGTKNKAKLGANAILAVSLATAKAAANSNYLELYQYLGGTYANTLPVPLMNILNGGAHADNNVDIQEFMIVPAGAPNFATAIRWGAEVFQNLKSILGKRKLTTAVGDEGGFAPNLANVNETLDLIIEAIQKAGRKPGKDIWLALDCAANEFYVNKKYDLAGEGKKYSNKEFAKALAKWSKQYPIISIEDGMEESDWTGWQYLTDECGKSTQLVGDDLFVTQVELLQKGIDKKIANAILIKPNQCGSLSETQDAVRLAQENNYGTVMSHRSGETEDTTIADLSVAWNCGQIKTGAPSRGERTAKFNRLLRIERELGSNARFAGTCIFNRG